MPITLHLASKTMWADPRYSTAARPSRRACIWHSLPGIEWRTTTICCGCSQRLSRSMPYFKPPVCPYPDRGSHWASPSLALSTCVFLFLHSLALYERMVFLSIHIFIQPIMSSTPDQPIPPKTGGTNVLRGLRDSQFPLLDELPVPIKLIFSRIPA